MKKEAVWKRGGNKMVMESGHHTFDRQTDCISTGNVWASTQTSGYIRAHSETQCNGFIRDPGHLQNYDLNTFKNLPMHVRNKVITLATEKSVILYKFFHAVGSEYRGYNLIVHGYVIMSTDDKLLAKFVTGPTWKSESVINECIKYINADYAGD